ncbi:hypothetical protein BLOT_005046 [Blomia tropicalis]|nr:hypothetical protein BLOT_005046 [Blomia tropicalis]
MESSSNVNANSDTIKRKSTFIINNNNNNNNNNKDKSDKDDNAMAKYNLRTKSIQNRIEVERRKNAPRRPKPKQRPAPLSKYRRKTANFRERCRMQEMNDAFKRLQSAVPDVFTGDSESTLTTANKPSLPSSSTAVSAAKLTKIHTLKLAVNYISALTQLLNQADNTDSRLSIANNENRPTQSILGTTVASTIGGIQLSQGSRFGTPMNINCSIGAAAATKTTTTTATITNTSQSLQVSRNKDLSHFVSKSNPQLDHRFLNGACQTLSSPDIKISSYHDNGHEQCMELTPTPIYRYEANISQTCDVPVDLNATFDGMQSMEPIIMNQNDSFDLSPYSLPNDGTSLLDDFNALIDGLQEDTFSLVNGLID